VVNFNMVLEAADVSAPGVTVRLPQLVGPGGFVIKGRHVTGTGKVFDWRARDIELFYVRYLQIRGLSRICYDFYDERHIPARFRRPTNVSGAYTGTWADRPDHDKYYPDIAVPMELVPSFTIEAGRNQSVWADIYIPADAPPGLYVGEVTVKVASKVKYRVPVQLDVRSFMLPDEPTSRTMVATGYGDVARRYTGVYPLAGSAEDKLAKQVMTRQMLVAHRHRISLVDTNDGAADWAQMRPRPEWVARLSGELFTDKHAYKGPGMGVGNKVFAIGLYGIWERWWGYPSKSAFWSATNKWESWFAANFPDTERFLYLADESDDYAKTQTWASWIRTNPGVGSALLSFATARLPDAQEHMPSLDITGSHVGLGDTPVWNSAYATLRQDPRKSFYLYNGRRPGSGTFAIEDEGVALRELAWGQYKRGISRWFFWNATYYNDSLNGRGPTNVFTTAQTFGAKPSYDSRYGTMAGNSGNGDGVLFYPGTDKVFPAESFNLAGPIASLRLKYWRRGIQDVDYIALAAAVDPVRTNAIVARMVPKVLWENGVSEPDDPTWVIAPISWSIDPDDWEAARAELAEIIESPAPQTTSAIEPSVVAQ
jgi:hypothetical protein